MVTLFNLFGEPQQLAFQHTLIARDYKLACNWLRSVEALFRKLLLIEASHYANDFAATKPRAKRTRTRKLLTFFPEHPDDWRTTFRTMERGRPRPRLLEPAHTGEDARAPYLAPTKFHSAWPLAERFEALLRVHNDPAPYAKRLARRLYAAPQRIAAIIREPPELQHRIDPQPHAALDDLIGQRTPVFDRRRPDSS